MLEGAQRYKNQYANSTVCGFTRTLKRRRGREAALHIRFPSKFISTLFHRLRSQFCNFLKSADTRIAPRSLRKAGRSLRRVKLKEELPCVAALSRRISNKAQVIQIVSCSAYVIYYNIKLHMNLQRPDYVIKNVCSCAGNILLRSSEDRGHAKIRCCGHFQCALGLLCQLARWPAST